MSTKVTAARWLAEPEGGITRVYLELVIGGKRYYIGPDSTKASIRAQGFVFVPGADMAGLWPARDVPNGEGYTLRMEGVTDDPVVLALFDEWWKAINGPGAYTPGPRPLSKGDARD